MIVVQPAPPFVPMPTFFAACRAEPVAAEARVGRFFTTKYRAQAGDVGYQQAARNLRKQGVPLEVARLVLLGRV